MVTGAAGGRTIVHTTSASLPEAQLIAYYLREPPGRSHFLYYLREPPGRSNVFYTTSESLPGRKSLFRNNPCGERVHAQLIAYYLREPPRHIASGIILAWSTGGTR